MFLSRLKTIAAFVAACRAAILAAVILISALPGTALSGQDDIGTRNTGEAQDVVTYTIRRSDFLRATTQPGTVEAFESVTITPKFSGYLRTLNVDIGDAVKRGQVLAEIDAPEVVAEQNKAQAVVEQSIARLASARAVVTVAHASLEADKAKTDADAATVSWLESILRYRQKSLERLRGLAAQNSVERRLVDEAEENVEAAMSALTEAKAQVVTAKAGIEKAMAKLVAARSGVEGARADIHVAQAELENVSAVAGYTRIVSPWDGIVTRRGYHVGDYVRSGDLGGRVPLLSLIQTGKVKVIVDVPDLDAPYLDKGDRAIVRIDALGGRAYQGAIARTSLAQDPAARTVRAEIDLKNEDGRLRPGQYGRVTIDLQDRRDVLSIPVSALIDRSADGAAACYRIVDGRAVRARIKIGEENGNRMEVVDGLKEGDSVIADSVPGIRDGQPVAVKNGTGNK